MFDLFRFSFEFFHIILVIFLTIIISGLFFPNKTKRTGIIILSSIILTISIGILINIIIPKSITQPVQYFIPILICLAYTVILLVLEEGSTSTHNNEPKNQDFSPLTPEEFEESQQEEMYEIIEEIAKEYELECVDKKQGLFINPGGMILKVEREKKEVFINLWQYFMEDPQTISSDSNKNLVLEVLESLDHLEIIPQWYNPRLLRKKYQDYILKLNVEELFTELPEDKSDKKWLSMLRERAALITLIKESNNELPNKWMILKFHHQIQHPPAYSDPRRYVSLVLGEIITEFITKVKNISYLYLQNFQELQAETPYAKTSLIYLHKNDLPPLHHLFLMDENYLDNYFEREIGKLGQTIQDNTENEIEETYEE